MTPSPLTKAGLLAAAREHARRAFFRSRTLRRAALVAAWPRLRGEAFDLAHLPFYLETSSGPVQRDEALMLHALTRVLRPRVVVEIGFLGGMSSLNFLTAMDPDARLYAFDITEDAERFARTHFTGRPNFRFIRRSQDEISSADVDGQKVDLVFLDASHELATNIRTFERLDALLADGGVLAVHDTGVWPRDVMGDFQRDFADSNPEGWIDGGLYQHRPEEREFVNWVREEHPEYAQLQLHSTRTLRHGMTLLQRSRPLPTNPELSARLRAELPVAGDVARDG